MLSREEKKRQRTATARELSRSLLGSGGDVRFAKSKCSGQRKVSRVQSPSKSFGIFSFLFPASKSAFSCRPRSPSLSRTRRVWGRTARGLFHGTANNGGAQDEGALRLGQPRTRGERGSRACVDFLFIGIFFFSLVFSSTDSFLLSRQPKKKTSLPPNAQWSAEEEEALKKGVKKYGTGRWRFIQKDEVLSKVLSQRSNVDLKVSKKESER